MADTNKTLAALSLSQKQALYTEVYEGGSDSLSTLGLTGCVRLSNYKLTVTDLGRKVAAAYAAA